jgi:hypothetical protein
MDHSLATQTFRYWEIFLSWLFSYPSRCYELKKKREIFQNPCKKFHQFGQTYRHRLASKGIICQVTPHKKDIEKTCNILRLIHKHIPSTELSQFASAEVITKVLSYRNLKRGHTIQIPTIKRNGTLQMISYEVDKVFNLWSKVHAFGLTSSNPAPPLLLYRGTNFTFRSKDGRASIISDFDPKGPGRALFDYAKEKIHRWLGIVTEKKGPARVMGHSLGGTFVAYTLIHEHPYLSRRSHETSYAFNLPGISEDLVEKWEAIPAKRRPAFKGVIARGDVVSKFGYLFGDTYEISLKTPLSPIRAHEMLLFAEPLSYLHKVDLEKENDSPSRHFYSKIHKHTSSMAYELGLKLLFPN